MHIILHSEVIHLVIWIEVLILSDTHTHTHTHLAYDSISIINQKNQKNLHSGKSCRENKAYNFALFS